jgi:hypothetical protein
VARARISRVPWLFQSVGILSGCLLLVFAATFAWRAVGQLL